MPDFKAQAFLAAMHARESDACILDLLTIQSPELAQPVRLVNNPSAVVSRGMTFEPWAFQIPAPGEREDRLPQVTLVMDAIFDPAGPMELGPVGMINTINTGTATLEWILLSAPDSVQYGPFDFTIQKSSFDASTITVQLSFEDLLNAAWPGYAFTPGNFPALFEG